MPITSSMRALKPVEKELPANLQESVERIAENCEPALSTVLFMAGAGGSLRAGVTENPVRLTRSVRQAITRVTAGGAPVYVWPGGGITYMVDVTLLPERAFGYVPTPALVAPIEFTMKLEDYAALGGHPRSRAAGGGGAEGFLTRARSAPQSKGAGLMRGRRSAASTSRLHLQDGPIDLDRRSLRRPTPIAAYPRGSGSLRRPSWTSSARSCLCCAPVPQQPKGVVARRMWDAVQPYRRATPSSRRWRRWPARWPKRCWAAMTAAAQAAARLREQWRRHRGVPGAGRDLADRHGGSAGSAEHVRRC